MAITIGEIVKYYREKLNMSQENLAENACSRKYVCDVEKNKSIPTLDIIDRFSKKLGVDLYATYGNMHNYYDIETYLKVRKINALIGKGDFLGVSSFVKECKAEIGFATGEAKQMILYAEAIVLAYEHKVEEAIELVVMGMRIHHPKFPCKNEKVNSGFNNVEYALLLSYGTMNVRMGNREVALISFNEIKQDSMNVLSSPYEAERSKAFFLNLLCSAVYNKYVSFREDTDEQLAEIEEVLDYQKRNNRIHMLPELLLCLSDICDKRGELDKALIAFNQAKVLGVFYRGEEGFKKLSEAILSHK